MDINVNIQHILNNLSERGLVEWQLAVQKTENQILREQLQAHTNEEE